MGYSMNSNGQTSPVSGLLGAAGAAPSRASKTSTQASGDSSSSLKNKDFSNVMDDQRQRQQASPAKDSAASADSRPVSESRQPEQREKVADSGEAGSDDGKALPAEGEDLPPAAQSGVAQSGSLRWWAAASGQGDGATSPTVGATSESAMNETQDTVVQAEAVPVTTDQAESRTATSGKKSDTKTDEVSADVVADGTAAPVAVESPPVKAPPATAGAVQESPTAKAGGGRNGVRSSSSNVGLTVSTQTSAAATTGGDSVATTDTAAVSGTTAASPTPANQFGASLAALAQKRDSGTRTAASSETAVREAAAADVSNAASSASNAHPGVALQGSTYADGAAQNAALVHTSVAATVGKPGWSEGVAQQVMWMSSQHISKAEIALDPPDLGPLHVRISTHGDHTSVSFSSAHGVVRDALDQGLPKLRDMMQSQGINLADVDVSDQNLQQQAQTGSGARQSGSSGPRMAADSGLVVDDSVAEGSVQTMAVGRVAGSSLVDHYV